MKYWTAMTLWSWLKMNFLTKPSGGGWMCPCGACAIWAASMLSLCSSLFRVEGLQVGHQIGDIFGAQPVRLRVRHGADRTLKAVLQDLRDVLTRRRQTAQQL